MVRRTFFLFFFAVIAFAISSPEVFAHTGQGMVAGFEGGVVHPIFGWDHLLVMLAVGICAACIGGSFRWLLPAGFLLAMVLASGIGQTGVWQLNYEFYIACSVLVMGLALILGQRLQGAVTLVGVVLFGLFHGYAHGVEATSNLQPFAYGIGFLTTTALLHGFGYYLGALQSKGRALVSIRQTLGLLYACAGVYLISAI